MSFHREMFVVKMYVSACVCARTRACICVCKILETESFYFLCAVED